LVEYDMQRATASRLRVKPAPARRLSVLRWFAFGVTLVAATYLALCTYFAHVLTTSVRNPVVSIASDMGIPTEAVAFPSAIDNVPLKGWYMGAGQGQTIILLHAKDGTRADPTIGLLDIARALVQHGYSVLAFDFRGHGQSGGSRVSLAALEPRDVAGALVYLKSRGITSAGVLGFSMGAATALNAAAEHPELRAVVADSAFADLDELFSTEIPKEGGVPKLFDPGIEFMSWLMFGMDMGNNKPARSVAHLGNRPVLLIHGTADYYVPLNHAYELQRAGAADPNLQLWIVPGAEHVRAFRLVPEEYLRRVIGFFDAYLR
jgi:pimeloyl-ACP methyl ester carboxylesterase